MLKIFRRKKKRFNIPKAAFELPPKYRFTFVCEGWSYEGAYVVKIGEKIPTIKKALYIASQLFREKFPKESYGTVAVFYGNAEAPDCDDVLYGAYSSFSKTKK